MREEELLVFKSRRLVAAAFAVMFVKLVSASPALQTASAATELEGVWQGHSSAEEGRVRELKPGLTRLTFRGEVMLAVGFAGRNPAEERTLSFRVNPRVSPKTLDIVESPSLTREALYEVSGDELRIALSLASAARPKSFATTQGSGTIVLMLKRAGKNF